MWEVVVEFDQEETMRLTGEEKEIPLLVAIRYYNLFVKEAEGSAIYKDKEFPDYIKLEEKIQIMTERTMGKSHEKNSYQRRKEKL